MKFLFVTYRWGQELIGGAEIHHRRLIDDLVALGHSVEIWTTTGSKIAPVGHWGVRWEEGYPAGFMMENDVAVTRFPLAQPAEWRLKAAAKFLQRRIEAEWADIKEEFLDQLLAASDGTDVELLDGWHHAEIQPNRETWRWSWKRARVSVPEGFRGTVWINGIAPKSGRLSVHCGGRTLAEAQVHDHFSLTVPIDELPSRILEMRIGNPFQPIRDHRTLGVLVKEILFRPPDESTPMQRADLANDYRALGRRNGKTWWDHLWNAATRRPPWMSRLFDWLRGPRCPELWNALGTPPEDVDYVIAANLPWAVIPNVSQACPLPVLSMALWHMDDDYYYWSGYIDGLRASRFVLANTEFSAREFFTPRGIRAEFVGPGVPMPGRVAADFSSASWKESHGIASDEAVVLTICRKSAEKRYQLVSDAVGKLRQQDRLVRHVLIGPDADRREVSDHVVYLGRVSDDEIEQAYRACDVFALMSESESFGMVLAEAWLRGKPVIANEFCGPAASLIAPGEDGLVARDETTLADAIALLLDNSERAKTMGEAGRKKAEERFVQRAATERLLAAIDDLRR
ncbi:glycosyltransferase family 4 protein [bacterium]|nr:glycosyltransferase family 4 protein [bacterium]